MQLVARDRHAAAPADHLDGLDEVADRAAVADAGVAVERAADGAGDADRELEAAEPAFGRRAAQRGHHHRGPGADTLALEAERARRPPQRDDERVDALVGDEQVRAAAEHAHGERLAARPGEQQLELRDILGNREVARRPAEPQVGMPRERHVLMHLDAVGRGRCGHGSHGRRGARWGLRGRVRGNCGGRRVV